MTAQPFVLTPDAYPKALSVVGVDVTVMATKQATQAYEITFQEGDEGSGPPLHYHPWDETFYVIAGGVEFHYGGKTIQGIPGTLFHMPAGTPHGFRITANGSKMLEITGQGSRSIDMFTSIDAQIAAGLPTPADVPKLIEILAQHDAVVGG